MVSNPGKSIGSFCAGVESPPSSHTKVSYGNTRRNFLYTRYVPQSSSDLPKWYENKQGSIFLFTQSLPFRRYAL